MTRVDVDSVPGWAEACSSAFVPLRVRSAAPAFRARLRQHSLAPGISLARVSSGASEVYRADRTIRQHPRDDVLISLHRTGSAEVAQHGRRAKLGPGGATMYDASAPYVLSFPGRMSEIVLQLPRRSLPQVGHAFADLTARPLPEGGPLRALTALAVASEPGGDARPLEDAAIADALVGLVGALASSEVASQPPRIDSVLLLTAVRQHIDDHLTDPSLTPELVAHRHHVSLRLLQKLFARGGDSPAAYIRRRRLESARRLLLQGAAVAGAANAVGFVDVDTFGRAFKREFGVPPSGMRPSASAPRA